MRVTMRSILALSLLLLASCAASSASDIAQTRIDCSSCAEWNAPHAPVRIFGNTYYVGPVGLGAILVTSPTGHVIIDGALPQSAPQIIANVEALGFRMKDVKLILNSHPHFDHAGGIAQRQRASGAIVAASPLSAAVLRTGRPAATDPQYQEILPFPYPPMRKVREIADGETLHAGSLELTAHFPPGHAAGGTTWSWKSCEGARCLDVVYADSVTPVSEKDFRFSHNERYPNVLADFAHTFTVLESMKCDILLTPHPSASSLWERLAARDRGDASTLIDANALKQFVDAARKRLAQRVASEQ
jgi:metallo-beta-lactamase class B